jgi:hypothetical protein
MAPLLPKLRGHFAEFLNHSSPARLGILYLTTCVGLGYGPCYHWLEAFLDSMGSLNSPQRLRITSHPHCSTDLPMLRATGLHQHYHRLAQLPSCVTPSLNYHHHQPCHLSHTTTPSSTRNNQAPGTTRNKCVWLRYGRVNTGTGISTRYPSTTPVGLALGPDSPWADEPSPGTLGHTAAQILTALSLLMPAFSLPHPPHQDSSDASPNAGRSPTRQHPSQTTRA